mgnify:FL=1
MSKLDNFKRFLAENKDAEELKAMGFSDRPDGPFIDRMQAALDEWGMDPEVGQALDLLKKRTNEILDQYIDLGDDEDNDAYSQYSENIMNSYSIDEMGFFEYMVASGNF